jgi:hypothetical protein
MLEFSALKFSMKGKEESNKKTNSIYSLFWIVDNF